MNRTGRRTWYTFQLFATAAVLACCAAAQEKDTVVEITGKVLVSDCIPFGVNIGYDSYYAAPWRKERVRESFEGTTYRQCLTGHVQDETGMSVWVGTSDSWRKVHIGARFTILNGPARGTTGTIKDITKKTFTHQGADREFTYYVFDRKVPARTGEPGLPGLFIERFALDEGFIGAAHDFWRPNAGMEDKTPRVDVLIGDVRPGSPGRAACHLIAPAGDKPAFARLATMYQTTAQTNGPWHVEFWAKALKGAPKLEVIPTTRDPVAPVQTVELAPEWREYKLDFDVSGVKDPADWTRQERGVPLFWIWRASGGEALIDELSAQMTDEENPTPFRDDLVAVLKELNPGSLRYLQMGGNTVDNALAPSRYQHRYTSMRGMKPGPYGSLRQPSYSLPEFYELCEHLQCDPWYSLPGTLHPEAVEHFVEFLAGPADKGYGKLRADLGRQEPWPAAFRYIHVEFGNEAWNAASAYHSGGFNGSGYWTGLIDAGKKSPYYAANVLFQPAGQANYPGRNEQILRGTRNGDMFSIAPYMFQNLNKADLARYETDEGFFRWVLAWPIFRSFDPRGVMYQNDEIARKAGIEMSTYEYNYHTDKGDATIEDRRRVFTTQGGAMGFVNTMLLMLKQHGIRVQNSFPLRSGGYHGLFDLILTARADKLRVRPSYHAQVLANKVVGGDLVETVHSGAVQRWSGDGIFYREWRKPPKVTTYADVESLWSYAFVDGDARGLVLVNLDVERAVPVQVKFAGSVAGGRAESWLLTANSLTASNEWAVGEPQVAPVAAPVEDFASGSRLSVPPFSMLVLRWRAE